MSSEAPADAAQRANWLPAPKGDFSLYIRSYWPEAAMVEGKKVDTTGRGASPVASCWNLSLLKFHFESKLSGCENR